MGKESNMAQLNKEHENPKQQEHGENESRIAVPVDLQIELAENRRSLAKARYEISVRKGSAWDTHTNKLKLMLDK